MDLFNRGLHAVEPVKPIAPWQGGKKQLAKRICLIMEAIPHRTYAEPFIGMGGVFFRRRRRPDGEFINDLNGDVANLFRVLRYHYCALIDEFRFSIASREWFANMQEARPAILTDVQRAARFIYLQRLAFGGRVRNQCFGVAVERPARFNIKTLEPMLADVHDRLSGVVIEQLDWSAFVDAYDGPETLFYLDPPYYGCEGDYGADFFARSDFARMAEMLEAIEGAFILSLNDHEDVRRLFAEFHLMPVSLTYTVGKSAAAEAKELLIMNEKARAGAG